MLAATTRWIGVAAASIFANAVLLSVLHSLRKRTKLLTAAREKSTLDLQNLQQAFHQFAPQRVVEEVIKQGVSTSGETREVTVLFADIVEFTAMSESVAPETLVRILNGYFEATCTAVTHHGGHIAKFLGDGIMAIFGAPETNAWQSLDAVIAALSMREAVRSTTKSWAGKVCRLSMCGWASTRAR